MLSETVIEWTKKWKEEGRAEGEAQGRAEGEAQGRAEGEAQGRQEERRQLALRLLGRDMSVADVAELTGMTLDEVQALRRG